MGKINREDMLELTRRMTLKWNCFDRDTILMGVTQYIFPWKL